MRAVVANKLLQRAGRHLACSAGLVFLLLELSGGTAGAARITNEPNGFNGYTWGAASTQYPSLQLVTDPLIANPQPEVEVYENPGENLTLNGVTFTRVYYRFLKGQLGSIEFRYEGRENREKLRQWIEDHYGKVPPPERKQKHIEWHGENTVISLGYDLTSNLGRLWFIYLALSPFDNSLSTTGAVQ